ncbi:MAG: biotin/lipoyl-binding protein, partial [Deltaproteobacteria bacterium]|nr:biotin/lipoyl-binding protein [Deltaproteobacteria bacterium]
MTQRAKKIVVVLGVLLGGGAAAWLALPRTQGAAEPPRARAAATSPLVVPGVIEPASDAVPLSFEQPGRVVEVLVAEGDRVVRGQVVARLDDRLASARVRQAEAALAAARARRDRVVRGARPEELRMAEADARAASAVLRERTRAASRAAQLLAAGAGTEAASDGAHDAVEAADATAASVDARVALLRRGERRETRREAIAAVEAAEASLEEARVLLDQTLLRAPRDGVVLRRFVEPGQHVAQTP